MAGTTTKGFRYPTSTDAPAVHTAIFNLATDVDTKLDSYTTTALLSANYATIRVAQDTARVAGFLAMA